MEMNLRDKVVIVTGAGRGIGRAIASACAAQAAKVVVADYGILLDGSAPDPSVAEEAAAAIRAEGGEAIAVAGNVARMEGANSIVDAALGQWGRIDGLVCCAGILRHRPFLELTESDFDAVIATHLKGHFLMFQSVMRQMVEQGTGGSLIGFSSGYLLGDPARTPYRAAKAGIVALVKSVAMAGTEHGIRANAIAPIAETRMTHASKLPISAAPEDIAPMAVYLLSDASKELAGEVFSVAGNAIGVWDDAHEIGRVANPTRWTQDEIAGRIDELMADRNAAPVPVPPLPDSAKPTAEPEV